MEQDVAIDAASTNFDSNNRKVRQAIEEEIASGREIGVQVAAYVDGELVLDCFSGIADVDTGRTVDGDTLFNRYSVTKAVIATALHIQADRGLIDYDAPVSTYWPEFAANGKGGTTVRHVVTHRAGIPQMPEGVTPERMCDWDWMVEHLGTLTPIAEPGTRALYQSLSFGWLIGELVRRSDPHHRSIARFVQEEIAQPLGITDLWIGMPDSEVGRLARSVSAIPQVPVEQQPALAVAATPAQVALGPDIYTDNADVRRTGIPAVGGIFNARSEARFWAMLAHGGELDGARLLSEESVANLHVMRDNPGEPDEVMYGIPIPLTIGGFWRGGPHPPIAAVGNDNAICHPGYGNNIGWADRERKLAVSICHNRLSQPMSLEDDAIYSIACAVRTTLGFD